MSADHFPVGYFRQHLDVQGLVVVNFLEPIILLSERLQDLAQANTRHEQHFGVAQILSNPLRGISLSLLHRKPLTIRRRFDFYNT